MKSPAIVDILLEGRPAGTIETLPEPQQLYLPLQSKRLKFSELCVEEGQQVSIGQILAKDPDNFSIPLLAPRAGGVRLSEVENHIVLQNITPDGEQVRHIKHKEVHVSADANSVNIKRQKLIDLGAWQFFYDAHDMSVPDPSVEPRAVIVSTLHLEPFTARGNVQIKEHIINFTRGLEHVQSLLEYQTIYLILPEIQTELSEEVQKTIRGYARGKIIKVPIWYPCDNLTVIARKLGLQKEKGSPVWALLTEGVLAIEKVLSHSQPCVDRFISLGGPAVKLPLHLKAMAGYPIEKIVQERLVDGPVRIINGGVFTGQAITEEQKGLPAECSGLTVLRVETERELLSFTRGGSDRRSYSNSYLSCLASPFRERLTTAIRGELRPCVACGFCEDVCPAGIMPYLIHKTLYEGELEDVELVRVDLCVGCGLCSFVCPSKIDLRGQFVEAQEVIRRELHGRPEVQA
ncbi:MAG: 4Fe-4S dicluster domain-containing protein [Sedimentisphaerales bacterium]|nr:4Fe-4S dicluster domain-containing protein [Sedimentisphaerales bacterium]